MYHLKNKLDVYFSSCPRELCTVSLRPSRTAHGIWWPRKPGRKYGPKSGQESGQLLRPISILLLNGVCLLYIHRQASCDIYFLLVVTWYEHTRVHLYSPDSLTPGPCGGAEPGNNALCRAASQCKSAVSKAGRGAFCSLGLSASGF